MKRKDFRILAIILVLAFMVSGCAQLRDKFVRKPKKEEVVTRGYQAIREYDVRPNMELYTKRYIFWKTWHKQLLSVLSQDNHKKKITAVEQEVSNLMDMQNMLVDEKAEQLQGPLDELLKIEGTLKKQKVTLGNEVRIRRKLEALGKKVRRNFSYNKVRGLIRSDFDFRTEEDS